MIERFFGVFCETVSHVIVSPSSRGGVLSARAATTGKMDSEPIDGGCRGRSFEENMHPALGRLAYTAATIALGEQRVFAYLREARGVRRLGTQALLDRQSSKLHELLTWLAREHPYYGTFVHARPSEGSVPALDRLHELPLLEKDVLQRDAERLITPDYKGRRISKSTGGSTGSPVRVVKDADGIAREMAASWAAMEDYGIGIGDRSVRFWGTPLKRSRRFRFWLTDMAMNRKRLSAFDLDPSDFERYWNTCRRFKPRWFYGYASLIHMFAEWIRDAGFDGKAIGLKAIVPTSEPLNPGQREVIRDVFGAQVFDEYGCGEVGAMAYACKLGRLHVVTENVVLEVLDEQLRPVEPGETGEVVVTDLTNHAMPLIRYRLGDRAVQGSTCECGNGFPVIERVLGRIHDVVYTPAGRRWHGEKIDYLMSQLYGEIGGFRQYQVVQDSASHLEIRLVTDDEIPNALKATIQDYVRDRLDGMTTTVVAVTRIERAASGKIRVVRNDWLPHGRQPH
jgi:phenylacetate-CoA ligase